MCHVLPLDIKVKASQVCVVISRGWIAAQAVAVMLRFYDVAEILHPISVNSSSMFITEVCHCNTVFQNILSHIQQRVHFIWQLTVFQPKPSIRRIRDSRPLENTVNFLLRHREI